MMRDTLDIKLPWRAALRLRIFVPALLIGSLVYWGTAIRPYLRLDDARVAARCTEVRSEQSGRLAALSHEEGAAIKQGEALFSFNTEEETEQQKQLQASIAMLNEVLARHLANADKAMQEYLTVRSEVEMGIASQEQTGKPLADLQEKQTLSKDCKEKLAAAVVSLDQVRRRMEQKTIPAPSSGIVIQRFKHEGEFLKAGEPVYSLCDPSQTWIEAVVPEKMIARVAIGQLSTVRLAAEKRHGTVSWISPTALPNGKGVPIRIALDKESGTGPLRPNLSAQVTIKIH